jgi:hypothetical protein
MLPRLRHHHDWCTNGPCAGSISPMMPWSTLHGRSACRCALRNFAENFGTSGSGGNSAAGIGCPPGLDRPDPGCGRYTQAWPSRSSHAYAPAKILVASSVSASVSDGISLTLPVHGSNSQP